MLSVAQALETVLAWARPLPPCRVPLDEALGCVLAESIIADLDLPPFDKALMDGYAVRSADCSVSGLQRFSLGEEITAGRTPTRPLAAREAAVIMTGAPLPEGADAVVMHEKTTRDGDSFVMIPCPVSPGDARLRRGREMTKDQVLFSPGERLNAPKLGVLASVGKASVLVRRRPRVVIVPTGDELVAVDAIPGPGQIRETNATVLSAMARSLGLEAIVCPVAPDDSERLRHSLVEALAHQPDVLLICGGVSAGKRDLVPEAIGSIGVVTLFHKVRLKPGKPLLFGVRGISEEGAKGLTSEDLDRAEGPVTLVFGLPGNPVSGMVGFLLFVEPALRQLHDANPCYSESRFQDLVLETPFRHRGDRPTFHPAKLDSENGSRATPLEWAGSSDLFTVARADGFLRFDEGDRDYEPGESVKFLKLRGDGI